MKFWKILKFRNSLNFFNFLYLEFFFNFEKKKLGIRYAI
jgi:hypothetical protein